MQSPYHQSDFSAVKEIWLRFSRTSIIWPIRKFIIITNPSSHFRYISSKSSLYTPNRLRSSSVTNSYRDDSSNKYNRDYKSMSRFSIDKVNFYEQFDSSNLFKIISYQSILFS